MTDSDRLKVYKDALKEYRWARWPWLNRVIRGEDGSRTSAGFCMFFESKDLLLWELPELYSFRPSSDYICGYWFKPGKLTTRIWVLENAIRLTKLKL